MKFDGCKVKETLFGDIGMLARFFIANGDGYTKTGATTCIDDYSQRPVQITADTVIWVKV